MEENKVISGFETPDEEELAQINKFTRREFKSEEVYAFSVVLCDNEVDRDYERFTDDALHKLAELFKGVTGIFDHSHKSENQCARIFKCYAETLEGVKNSLGEPYCRLFARAYMPRSEKAAELMLEIDAGIKKEVSVGCSMAKSSCSICGQPAGVCNHSKGKFYRVGGVKRQCFFELSEPKDAYEWSFVAVPAQPAAGVVKGFFESDNIKLGDFIKAAQKGKVTLTVLEAQELSKQFKELYETAEAAGEFLKNQKLGLIKTIVPEASECVEELMLKALDRLEPSELFRFKNEIEKSNQGILPQLPLAKRKTRSINNEANNIFKV